MVGRWALVETIEHANTPLPEPETYNPAKPHLPPPMHSRNLAVFSAPSTSPWMLTLLSSPFHGHETSTFGQQNTLFDALQLLFSHLVLDPISPMALSTSSSRADYDLQRVYNWNRPFETLYQRLSTAIRPQPRILLFPKLSPEPEATMFLDLHTLLHIRNFWRRQLTAEQEGTYAQMATKLSRVGHGPKRWDQPLDWPLKVSRIWFGHYSCLHPWAKSRWDLEERQTCAEDWEGVDALFSFGFFVA